MLLLKNGPQDMENILASMNTKRTVLLPQMKIMQKKQLLVKEEDSCELTSIGKIVTEKMAPLLNTLEFFDEYNEYWGTHNIDFIPPHLLKRITEIGSYTILEPPLSEIFEMNRIFDESLRLTTNSTIVTSIIYPGNMKLFLELVENGTEIAMITTSEVLNKLWTEKHDIFKKTFESKRMKYFLSNKEMSFPAFALNDDSLFFLMSKKDGNFENRVLMASSPGSLAWGRELCEYYLNDSTPVTGWAQLEQLLAKK